MMRTTLEIDDDVMELARDLARRNQQSIGRALSELARRGAKSEAEPEIRVEDGIPVWTHGPGAIPVTVELVRSIWEEE